MGGESDGADLPSVGDLVRDRDGDDPDGSTAVVTAIHADTPAADRYIPALQKTVAEVNPTYPADSPVVTVAYVSDLSRIDGWEQLTPEQLLERIEETNMSTYDFPAARLAPALDATESTDRVAAPNGPAEANNESTAISANREKKFDLATAPDDVPVDGSGDDRYVRRRSEYLRRKTELREPLPQALALREIGYSSSGVAKQLDTRKQTVESWMDEIAELYGESALETRPQSDPAPELE